LARRVLKEIGNYGNNDSVLYYLNPYRLGLLFGPMIGSVLNYAFGYSIPFFVIAIFFMCAEIPTYTQLPPDSTMKSFEKKKKLPIIKAFTSIKVVVTIANVMSITAGYTYFNPFFVNHM
jgi:predicted MFS family arabinose efflux permease